jgi:hypothetical protein
MATYVGSTYITNFMKLWEQSDQASERKIAKELQTGLDSYVQAQSDVLAKIKVGKDISTPVARWLEERGYPSHVTCLWNGSTTATFSGYLFGEAVSATSLMQVVRNGTILERPSDGVQIKLTDIAGVVDGSAYTAVCEAYGNTSGSADNPAVEWDIISEVWTDYTDATSPRSLDRFWREVGTQIHAETFEIPQTRKNTKYEVVVNEVEHQITALLEKLRRQLAYAVLRSRPYYSSTYKFGDKVEYPTMCGILTWPVILQSELANTNVYVDKSSVELTKTDLDNLARYLWMEEHADYNTGSWYVITDPVTHQYIQDFDISYRRMEKNERGVGFHVETFESKIGKSFNILSDRYMRPGTLIMVNLDKFTYGYYNNDRMNRKEIATSGRYQRWLISYQTYGVVARNPRSNIGMIYGLPTS